MSIADKTVDDALVIFTLVAQKDGQRAAMRKVLETVQDGWERGIAKAVEEMRS